MNILKKHWRFISVLVVLVGLLWFGYSEVGAKGQQVGTMQKSVQGTMAGHYSRLFKDNKDFGKPATSQGLSLATETAKIQEIEKRRNNMLRWETDAPYTLGAMPADASTEDLASFYVRKRGQLVRDLSYQPNVSFSTTSGDPVGFPSEAADKLTREKIAENLARLDVTRVVAASSQRAAIQSLKKFQFVDNKKAELGARGLPMTGAGKDAAGKPNKPYFEANLLAVSVRGNETAIYNFLVDLQRPLKGELRNRYLAVESFTLEKPDALTPTDDLLNAEITVVAYRINEDVPLPGSVKSSKDENTAGRARRFR